MTEEEFDIEFDLNRPQLVKAESAAKEKRTHA
jgi:hypothetical protein